VVVAVGLLALALAPLAAVPGVELGGPAPVVDAPPLAPTGGPPAESTPTVEAGPRSVPITDGRRTPRVDPEVRVVAEFEGDAGAYDRVHNKYDGRLRANGSTGRLTGTVSLSEVREFSSTPGVTAVHIEGAPEITDQYVAAGVATTGLAALHERGLTGENVTVGIIDDDFGVSHPSIASHVGAYRQFSDTESRVHGTAVASVVADAAPAAELHLAAVGSRTTPGEYREAVRWLRRSGADVVIDAGSYLGQPGDGDGSISRIAAEAADDVAFVTSAGNYAHRHWTGVGRTGNDSSWVDFGDGNETNYLAGGARFSGRVSVGLTHDGGPDYDLFLYRNTDAGGFVWASSTTGGPSENVSATVPRGRYYVAVRSNGSDPNATGPGRVSLFANRELGHRTASGSVTAPATAPGVVAVGAVDGTTVEPFSSRGPTADGRLGVDVVAPDDAWIAGAEVGNGTSYAAPYVAATVAVLNAEYPQLSAPEVADAVVASADDVGPSGPDAASGHGRLDAVAAAERVRELAFEGIQPEWPPSNAAD
jgi:subtilisin family serine protease